jgi:chemotaxis protein CheD
MVGPEISEIYLQPGEWQLVRSSAMLKTVLGSCVGITFRVPRLGIAAMCHPMLPYYKGTPRLDHGATSGRYVESIIRELAVKLDQLGATRAETEVKLFGGADVLAPARRCATVGKMNAETAVRVLKEEGFRLFASRLGGDRGMFIKFDTATGDVLLRRLSNMAPCVPARS